jgi:hypothetical protein
LWPQIFEARREPQTNHIEYILQKKQKQKTQKPERIKTTEIQSMSIDRLDPALFRSLAFPFPFLSTGRFELTTSRATRVASSHPITTCTGPADTSSKAFALE